VRICSLDRHSNCAYFRSWITLPQIGRSSAVEEELKQGLEKRVRRAVEVIDIYCPTTCNLSNLDAAGTLIFPDQASGLGS
jgi:hypothetical protein